MLAANHRQVTQVPSLLLAAVASVAAALLGAPALTGGNDHVAASPKYSQRASVDASQLEFSPSSSVKTEAGATAATNATDSLPLWQSDVMDSHESIASLAALPKSGNNPAKVSANPARYAATALTTRAPLALD